MGLHNSGSGKTTLANILAENKYPVFSADDYLYNENGEYDWHWSKLKNAHSSCLSDTTKAMEMKSLKIFVANTFVTEKELLPYLEAAKTYDYMVHTIIVENRHGGKNLHNVPQESLDRQKRKFNIQL